MELRYFNHYHKYWIVTFQKMTNDSVYITCLQGEKCVFLPEAIVEHFSRMF